MRLSTTQGTKRAYWCVGGAAAVCRYAMGVHATCRATPVIAWRPSIGNIKPLFTGPLFTAHLPVPPSSPPVPTPRSREPQPPQPRRLPVPRLPSGWRWPAASSAGQPLARLGEGSPWRGGTRAGGGEAPAGVPREKWLYISYPPVASDGAGKPQMLQYSPYGRRCRRVSSRWAAMPR